MKTMQYLGIAALATAVVGCASVENDQAIQTERELAAAGFQMKMADTPEKLTHTESLPQRTLTPTDKDGEVVYVYADAKSCKCIYVGSRLNYARYERISLRQEAVDKQRMAAEDVSMAADNVAMNWGLWGPWVHPFYP
ncbi:MAG: hypothetical protein AAGA91_16285 [Pseudomonadota bacterium]